MSTIDIITKLLKEQNKKQKDLTDYLGITKNAFTDWKSGRIKSYKKHLPQIAEFFDVSVDYLLGCTDQPDRDPAPSPLLSPEEQTLVENYRALDSTGKGKASDYLDDLAKLYGLHKQEIPGGYAFTDPGTELTEDDMKEFEE